MTARALCLIALLGCGRISFDPFGAATGDGGPRDGSQDDGPGGLIDGPPVDAAVDAPIDARTIVPVPATGCTPAMPATTFPGVAACADWMATATTSDAIVSEAGGALSISPSANVASAYGQCARGVAFDAPGIFVEISDVVDGASSTTYLSVAGGGETYSMGVSNGQLRAQNLGTLAMVPYDPVAMRWWRMRPLTTGVLFETAPDASAWTVIATSNRPSAQAMNTTLFAGVAAAEAAPGVARFEGVNVCP